ncbi:RER1-like protein-retention of ER protein [Spironucleus salmonicida]|uniref:RER1-like protein-retention of ER protein n=1 Tax=Spironucleus salmonicida TaxID=348837 RepID=V6LN04_9EUKA|nr:RER1-like protein-retention of ER protein [Spironucleus salmonicida]|eukprot:EST46005.1 RER1-like protein-retention of ER protein [Spironucleus salmonicida]
MQETLPQQARKQYFKAKQQLKQLENLTAGFSLYRWIGTTVLTVFYLLFVLLTHSHYAIVYFLYIYILSAFIQFISPKTGDSTVALPVSTTDLADAKNYQREMCEFDFWFVATIWTFISLILSFFPFTDIPVFWPVLVLYSIALTIAIVHKELQKWKSMNVDAKTAVKHWVGLNKPKYSQ